MLMAERTELHNQAYLHFLLSTTYTKKLLPLINLGTEAS